MLCLLTGKLSHSQNASTYFPSIPGYKWHYKITLLDSNNNPSKLITYQIDSFANVQQYQGLLANVVLSKTGLLSINETGPFLDTSYYNFQTTNAWKYLKLIDIDTLPINIGIINFLRSFEKWYSTFRFAQTTNTNYTIISKDTTITIDTLTLPLRVSSVGRRLNDQTVMTVNGNYLAKKFVITNSLFYLLTIPPLPSIPVPIVQQPDTVWIAENVWIVKEVIPSVVVDLSNFGFKFNFSIPGNIKELTSPLIGIGTDPLNSASRYELYQNFPNPFNPITVISYQLPVNSYVSLKVYDLLGHEIATLVNKKQNAGTFSLKWDASNFASGIYFYELEWKNDLTGSHETFKEVKQMLLVK